jgi:hypothetical protein
MHVMSERRDRRTITVTESIDVQWRYEATGDGTRWTQVNTLELRHPRLTGWLAGMIERTVRSSMRTAMARAKAIMERSPTSPAG